MASGRRRSILLALCIAALLSFRPLNELAVAPGASPLPSHPVIAANDGLNSTSSHPARHRARYRNLPTCHPHWGNGPVKRIYFYHVRKAGGTMILEYLNAVAWKYRLHLEIREYEHASSREEVGSRNDTFYVTNLRDPVERSISHFKYSARWSCEDLVRNKDTFVATEENARKFDEWNGTAGFEGSDCGYPFSFTDCAVNCYLQTFSGRGCSDDGWSTEYNAAIDRLLRYNMVLVFEKFKDPGYVEAVEGFFGVRGFDDWHDMFCGRESREANERVPLRVGYESVARLTALNEMDTRLYRDVATACWRKEEDGEVVYSFPKVDESIFVPQENRTVIGY